MHTSAPLFILGMAAMADAHMLLSKPTMFPNTGFVSKDNGPLVGPGKGSSNYPCKYNGPSSYDFTFPRTQIPIGSNYSLQLMGEAVHGGGSCQLSLTKDLEPYAKSVFKVIHSVEGGCPARNTPGNLGGDASSIDPFEYSFSIPAGIEPGQYTFAWTWFNAVGNKEMYMNCAPIQVTSGTSKRDEADSVEARDSSFFDSLPNMYLANIPDVDCTSPTNPSDGSNGNIKFPSPGDSVETNVAASALLPPVGTCYAPVGTSSSPSGGSSSPDSSPPPSDPSPAAGTSPAVTGPAALPSTAAPVQLQPTFGTPTAAEPASPTPPIKAAPAVVSPAPVVESPTPEAGGSTGACPTGQLPCSGDALVCIGGTQFGLCNRGCMIAQDVAAGTTCSGGTIMRRRARMYPPPIKRDARAFP